MDTDGVEILHAAHRNGVADSVAHGLELYLLPAVDIALNEYLRYRRGIEPRLCGDGHLLAAVCDSAARAAERECGTDNDGIADAVGNGKAVSAGAADKCYSMVAVRFIPGEVTGLYSAKNINRHGILDSTPINGAQLYKNANGLLGYGVRIKGYIGMQLANPDAVSAIVNISADKIPTAEQIDNMLVDAKATPASTYIFCHPKVLSMLNKYKGNVLQTMTGDMDVNRSFAAWNGIRFITSYNFKNGEEDAVKLA